MIITRNARRTVRRIAGGLAMLLFASHVLAAAGLCGLKAPVVAPTATEAPCPEHTAEHFPQPVQSGQHCPADDPSAQARTADLPGAQILATAVVAAPLSGAIATSALGSLRPDPGSPQRPLYARLQRLQL